MANVGLIQVNEATQLVATIVNAMLAESGLVMMIHIGGLSDDSIVHHCRYGQLIIQSRSFLRRLVVRLTALFGNASRDWHVQLGLLQRDGKLLIRKPRPLHRQDVVIVTA